MWVPASASLLSGCGQSTGRAKSGKESPGVPQFPSGVSDISVCETKEGETELGRVSSLSSGLARNAESVTALKRRIRGSGGFCGTGSQSPGSCDSYSGSVCSSARL